MPPATSEPIAPQPRRPVSLTLATRCQSHDRHSSPGTGILSAQNSSVAWLEHAALEFTESTRDSRDSAHDIRETMEAAGPEQRTLQEEREPVAPVTSAPSTAPQLSRLSMHRIVEPLQEGRPLDSPLAPRSASLHSPSQQQPLLSSPAQPDHHAAAMAAPDDDLIQANPSTTHTPPHEHNEHAHADLPDRRPSTDTFREAEIAFRDFDGVHFSPDTDEYVEVDRDGHEIRRVSARTSSGNLLDATSLLRTPISRPMSYAAPPPGAGMVYYPAPVPRMLNLPKRLSKLPAANVQAQRRSQLMGNLPKAARESAPWIPPITFTDEGVQSTKSQEVATSPRSGSDSASGSASHSEHSRAMLNQRMSMANAHTLPPHLRASMFFEHESVPHDVTIQSESAVATLDSILAASATAPVSAFVDHPYVGDVRKSVYAPEKTRHRTSASTALNLSGETQEKQQNIKKNRSSSIGRLLRRNSTDIDGETERETQSKPASRGSVLDVDKEGNTIKRRQSTLSFADDLERARTPSRVEGHEAHHGDTAMNSDPTGEPARVTEGRMPLDGDEQIEQDFKAEDVQEDLDDEPIYAQPTTLLAELQVRKAQLKSRTKTAATAFPGGMHSTLLQLDAVEQINAKKRQKQRVTLAWEDPHLRAAEEAQAAEADEDVPLGMLFPAKDGLTSRRMGDGRDWSRPLGLMERRDLEDNEPLSSRRSRLNPASMPLNTNRNTMMQQRMVASPDLSTGRKGDEADDEEETLAQRLRKLQTKSALDGAISDVAPRDGARPISSFSAAVFDEFPELNNMDDNDNDKRASDKVEMAHVPHAAEEDETLGQRRARLQREREASGGAQNVSAARPPLRQRQSLSNLLLSNPIGQQASQKHQQAAEGTLLHIAAQHQLQHKQALANTNLHSAGYMLDAPLVDSRPRTSATLPVGLLAEQRNRPANGAFAGGMYNGNDGNATLAHASQTRREPSGGLVGAQRSRPANGGFAGGAYNTTTGGALGVSPMFGMPTSTSTAYFASPTAGVAYGNNYASQYANGSLAYPMLQQQQQQQQQQPGMNNAAYMALSGEAPQQYPFMPPLSSHNHPHHHHPMAMAGASPGTTGLMPTAYAAGLQQQIMGVGTAVAATTADQAIDPNQRAAIDRWRMGVAQ